jgi:zinc finger FYVE domain-containing protein 26
VCFFYPHRIIQDFNLNSVKIYGLTSKYLAAYNRSNEVDKLVECIKSNADKEPVTKICDEILCLAVKTAIECHGPRAKSSVDGLIKLVFDTETKIQCYISSGQLKSAYLLAVQHNRLNDVKKILRQAEKTNQPHIKRLCEKKLNLNMNAVT